MMEYSYLLASTFNVLVWKVVTSLLVFFPLFWLTARLFFDSRASRIYFGLLPLFYVSLFITNRKIGILPNFPDTVKYQRALSPATDPSTLAGGPLAFYYFNTPLRVIGGEVATFMVINSLLFVVGAVLTWKAWLRITKQRASTRMDLVFLGLVTVWPAAIVHNATPLREGQLLFFWGVAMYGIAIWTNHPSSPTGWVYLFFGALGAGFLREEILLTILLFAGVIRFWYSRYRTVSIVLSLPLLIVGRRVVVLLGYDYLLDPEKLESLRETRASFTPNSYVSSVNWNTWTDVALQSVELAVMFLTSPLLTTGNLFGRMATTLDGIFAILVLPIAIVGGTYRAAIGESSTAGWILAVLVLAFGFGVIEYSIGGAVRHRMPLILNLLPIVAMEIERFLRTRFPRVVLRTGEYSYEIT